ncbi:TMP repeat-containing protein [Bacillus mycoides]|uniref:TMP repeat-containing protein n=1 Tax=Bacillus mycoides TaxID=1405 RepID=C2XXF3_BACMY|nr:TMP repeat-containing protein [Bacillus mycoides]
MAGRIKGITIEIGGNTQPLQNALKDVNKQSDSLAKELKDVERLLKFDPGNVEALAQKQQLLTQQIENTTQKLDKLKAAEQQVQAQFQNGKISEEQYRAFRREIEFTEGSLNGLKNKLGNMKAEQDNVASSTRQLETLFSATGKSVDDFAGALGNRLVNAIRSGTATSKQLEQAIGIIGREALGAETDIEKLQRALRSVDAGNSIQQVRNELRDLQQEAGRTEKKFEGLKVGLENVIGGMAAGGGIATAIEKAMDMSKLKTKIDITFDVPESSKKSVEEAIRGVTAYGVDAEESLAGVRRQWALNKNISDEANASIVKGAATIAQSYEGIDFTELIQETYEIGSELGITQESALGMVDALLKMGFPPEQLDIIAEYGSQLTRAGFKAEEVQAIMEAGVETGSWNIDNMLDGLKEGRIQLAEFAQGADKALKEALDGSGIATEQIEKWGAAVAKGGSDGSKAMVEVAKAIEGIEDPVKKNQVGVKVLATMFEDQGQNLTNTLINASEKTVDFQKNQDKLNESIKKMDASPAIKFQKAMQDLQVALQPVLSVIADVISKVAEWISNNPKLAATLTAVAMAIGIISGAIMALAPIVMTVMSFFEIGALAAAGLVAGIPLLIAALAAIGIAIYKNWDDIKNWTIEAWNSIKEYLIELWDGIVQSSSEAWNSFLETMHSFFDPIGQFFSDLWTGIGEICSSTWNSIVEFFSGAWASFTEMMHSFFDPIGEFFSNLWSGIVETASSWWTSLVTTASELWGTLVQAWQETWNTILTVLDPIISAVSTVLEAGWLLIQAGVQIAWAAISQYIIQPIQQAYDWVSAKIGELVTWLGTQWEIAKAVAQVAWGLFKQYITQPVQEAWSMVKEKFSDLVSWLSSQWELAKSYTLAGWNLVKQYVIQPVQELWNTTKEKLGDLAN